MTATRGDIRYTAKGLAELSKALRGSAEGAADMRELMHEVGNIVVRDIKPPRLSGKLATTARAGRGKTKAVIRVGGPKAPYAPVVHYGNHYRGISRDMFVVQALERKQGEAVRAIDNGVAELLAKHRLL